MVWRRLDFTSVSIPFIKKCDHLKINFFIVRPVSENDFVLINFNGKKNKLFDDIQVDTDSRIL